MAEVLSPRSKDLTGQKFGILTVKEFSRYRVMPSGKRHAAWLCECSCGEVSEYLGTNIKQWTYQVCKHQKREPRKWVATPEYRAWYHMKDRCLNNKNKTFHHYGGRGITVCNKWMKFSGFIEDVGMRPSKKHSLDRIDNDLGYFPGNCRWTDRSTQCKNKRKKEGTSSALKGVSYIAAWNHWAALGPTINKKRDYLGSYSTELEAALAIRRYLEKHGPCIGWDISLYPESNPQLGMNI